MKFLLALMFSAAVLCSNAQNCTSHALMQKGLQLEYHVYMPQMNLWKGTTTDEKVSRLVFEVDHVTDSAGGMYSTIIKRGFSIHNEKDHYERTIVLQCDGKNLLFPFDFYASDTLYTRDVYPAERRGKHGYAFAYTPLENAVTFIVPLAMDGITNLPEGKKQLEQKVKQRFWTVNRGLIKRDSEIMINIKSIKFISKETVKTDAGSFACFKFYVDSDQALNGHSMPIKYWLFFNNEAGLVKLEGPGGSIELVNIKK
jgi:hypothetical protein